MFSQTQVRELLAPFGLRLTPEQISQVLAYLELLLRWNARINLTAIRSPAECVTRHFGESLYLVRFAKLDGSLLDIGSGAGFPGLALKVFSTGLDVTLLEPVAKKRAFLKEVARTCGMESVDVRPERLLAFLKQELEAGRRARFDWVTSRAVGNFGSLIPQASECLRPGGTLCLWLSQDQAVEVAEASTGLVDWSDPVPIPLAQRRQIWLGRRRA